MQKQLLELIPNSTLTLEYIINQKQEIVFIRLDQNLKANLYANFLQEFNDNGLAAIFIKDKAILIKNRVLAQLTLAHGGQLELSSLEPIYLFLREKREYSWLQIDTEALIAPLKQDLSVAEQSFFYEGQYFIENTDAEININQELPELNIEQFQMESGRLNSLIANKSFREVSNLVNSWLEGNRQHVDLLLLKAYAELNLGNTEEAIRTAFAATQIEPKNITCVNFLNETLKTFCERKNQFNSLTISHR